VTANTSLIWQDGTETAKNRFAQLRDPGPPASRPGILAAVLKAA
jgi:hypothetical protein